MKSNKINIIKLMEKQDKENTDLLRKTLILNEEEKLLVDNVCSLLKKDYVSTKKITDNWYYY